MQQIEKIRLLRLKRQFTLCTAQTWYNKRFFFSPILSLFVGGNNQCQINVLFFPFRDSKKLCSVSRQMNILEVLARGIWTWLEGDDISV